MASQATIMEHYLDDSGEPITAGPDVSLPKGYALLSTKNNPAAPKKSVKELKKQAEAMKPADITLNPKGEGLYEMYGRTGKGDTLGQLKVPYSKVQEFLSSGGTFMGDTGAQERYAKDKAGEGKPVSWYQSIVQSPKLAPVPNEDQTKPIGNIERAAARTILATPAYAKQLFDAAKSMHEGNVSGGDEVANLLNPFQVPKQLIDQWKQDAKTDPKMATDNLLGSIVGLGVVGAATHGAMNKVGGGVTALRERFNPVTAAPVRERTNVLHRNEAGEVRQAKGQSPSVWLSPSAWSSLMGELYPHETPAETHGFNLPANDDLLHFATQHKPASPNPSFTKVQELLAKAHGGAGEGGIAIGKTRPSMQQNINVMREELNHTWQRGLTGKVSDHLSPESFADLHKSIPKGMADHLTENGYDDQSHPEMVTEAAAKLMDGRPERFGVSNDEAVDFLDKYFKEVTAKHGAKALEELQHVRGIATDAKARAIAEHSSTGVGQDNQPVSSVAAGRQGGDAEGIPAGGDNAPYQKQIESPEFRSWFGKSQVADEHGNPIQLYHGTNRAGFDSFKKDILNPNSLYGSGVYTTDDPKIANGYAQESSVRGSYDREDLRRYFTPGSFVHSYGGGLDKVLQFKEYPDGRWDVQVQAVDRQGNPLPFERPRWHSTMPEVSELNKKNGGNQAVYPLFASIQKPFDVDGMFTRDEAEKIFGKYNKTGWVDRAFTDEAEADRTIGGTQKNETPTVSGQLLYEYGQQAFDDYSGGQRDLTYEPPRETELPSNDAQSAQDQVNYLLKQAGYDGIKHKGGKITKGNAHNVYIAFDPKQIKSSIGNRGTFDPRDTNILRNREQVRTPEFKEWFGESKSVDENGNPLIFYHGTNKHFDTFDVKKSGTGIGGEEEKALFFSTNPKTANRAASITSANTEGMGAQVLPVYLKIENPYISNMEFFTSKDMTEEISEAKRLGHDSIVFPKMNYDGESETTAVFDPSQIKSSIGNSGAFDPKDPNILRNRERRVDSETRKRVEHMTPEEMRKALLTSDVTGAPNRRAFDDAEHASPAAAIGMSDADGLKALNDKFGYAAGNELLKAKAEALKAAGLDAYHEKGDEFLYRGKSPQDLKDKLEKARNILRGRTIQVTLKNGKKLYFKGADFSYGTGKDIDESESGLKQHKGEREQSGERKRGELRGITETGPE